MAWRKGARNPKPAGIWKKKRPEPQAEKKRHRISRGDQFYQDHREDILLRQKTAYEADPAKFKDRSEWCRKNRRFKTKLGPSPK